MEQQNLSLEIKARKLWENDPQNLDLAIDYLIDVSEQNNEKLLDDVWEVIDNKQELKIRLVSTPKCYYLAPRVQYLAWKEDPGDIENGLDVVQIFLIKGKQGEAEEALDMMFEMTESPIKLLEEVKKDSRLDSLRFFCEQRASQYQARNTLNKKIKDKEGASIEEERNEKDREKKKELLAII